jgi:hypothetical protein
MIRAAHAPKENDDSAGEAPPFLGRFSRQLRDSISAGAALATLTLNAACGGNSSGPEQNQDDASQTAISLASLEPYPLTSIGCFGPVSESVQYGPQCCFDAACYRAVAGATCETNYESAVVRQLLPPGSGSCGCQVEEEGHPFIAGPYASNPDAEARAAPGMCCYVVGSIGCTGRPFVLNGLGQIALATQRSDWSLFG